MEGVSRCFNGRGNLGVDHEIVDVSCKLAMKSVMEIWMKTDEDGGCQFGKT